MSPEGSTQLGLGSQAPTPVFCVLVEGLQFFLGGGLGTLNSKPSAPKLGKFTGFLAVFLGA